MTLPKELQDKWNEADKTEQSVDIGNLVICDICNADYTVRSDSGGFIFDSRAVCPECAKKLMPNIIAENESHYIKAACKEGQSFADFVREYRQGNNTIQVIPFEWKD